MSDVVREHHSTSPQQLRCAVITVSDTRTLENDTGGETIISLLKSAGHEIVERVIVPDDPLRLRPILEQLRDRAVDAILVTGGTGIAQRDKTYETIQALITKGLPGYGELFRMLSYQEIGPASMLSRAVGGLIDTTVVLTMPGSPAAVQLAMEKIIVFQLNHLVREARR